MSTSIFHSPFTTALSGSARETEDRIRNIFQYEKKRPPVPALLLACALALSCGGLVSCQASPTEADISYPPAFFGLPGEPLTVAAPAWASASESLGEPPLDGLTVDTLPTTPVDLKDFSQSESWNETVWLLSQDVQRDVALYGIIQFEHYEPGSADASGLYGIIVRAGEQWTYFLDDWDINLWAYQAPELWFADFDKDGQEELAFALANERGSMVWRESLYLIELDTLTCSRLTFQTPIGLTASYDPDSMTLYAAAGHQVLVMDESWVEGAPILDGRLENSVQMEFSFENGQIRCQMGYVPSEAPMSNPAVVDCIVSFQDGQFVLTEPTFSPNTLTAPGCLLLWTTNNGQVMQAATQEEYEAGGTPYGDEDGYLFYRF